MCIDSATPTNGRSWRDKKARRRERPLYKVYHHSNGHNHSLSIKQLPSGRHSTRQHIMATQQFVDSQPSQQMMNLTRLQTEVSNGTYKFTRPLTIVTCATQDKYIVYASCPHCLKGVQLENNGYYCPVHQWERVPVYRFTLRVLLQDWTKTEA